mgnify:CR=1 FL=1
MGMGSKRLCPYLGGVPKHSRTPLPLAPAPRPSNFYAAY